MEDLTRLEKVIEATAESETDLQPETRLEKVIIETGAKIQQEIAGAGGTLYNHKISIIYTSTITPSFNILSYNAEPYTLNDVINYLVENGYVGKLTSVVNGLTLNHSISPYSSNEYRYNICAYYDNSNTNAITLNNLIFKLGSSVTIGLTTSTETNISDTITEL